MLARQTLYTVPNVVGDLCLPKLVREGQRLAAQTLDHALSGAGKLNLCIFLQIACHDTLLPKVMPSRRLHRRARYRSSSTQPTKTLDYAPMPSITGDSMHRINTVTGPISADALGFTLMHEHMQVSAQGLYRYYPDLFGPDDRESRIVEALRAAKAAGIDSIVDATTFDLGRDPELLGVRFRAVWRQHHQRNWLVARRTEISARAYQQHRWHGSLPAIFCRDLEAVELSQACLSARRISKE